MHKLKSAEFAGNLFRIYREVFFVLFFCCGGGGCGGGFLVGSCSSALYQI